MAQKITPLGNRVVAERDKTDKVKFGKIEISSEYVKDTETAVVKTLGPDVKYLKEGDRIIYHADAITEVKIKEGDFIVVSEENVIATV